jgi:hypothetical protein
MKPDATQRKGGRTPRSVRVARWVLFGLLLVSAVLTLFGVPELQRAVAAGRWPPAVLAVAPILLGAFLVGYAAYRIALVRAGRYSAGKALVRIVLLAAVVGAVAGLALLPRATVVPGEGPVSLSDSLLSANPEVRALAAEIVRHRPPGEALAHVDRLVDLLGDPSPEVRRQARRSLVALAGGDVGGEGEDAAERWREHWRTAPAR